MEKLAIFAEGQTEIIFLEKFLLNIIDKNQISIKATQRRNGYIRFEPPDPNSRDKKYFVILLDCRGDGTVKSEMINFFENGKAAEYKKVLGLRDLHPVGFSEIETLKEGLKRGLPATSRIVLAVQEIEAWFIAENSHLAKKDPRLTADFIKKRAGLDISPELVEKIEEPAEKLKEIFRTVGKDYKKSKSFLRDYCGYLDYGAMYLELPARVPGLKEFVSELDAFFHNPQEILNGG